MKCSKVVFDHLITFMSVGKKYNELFASFFFFFQVAEKISLMDQYRLERERQLKMEEEEEIRRLRKELVPRAQPMPYFDRPSIPKRSLKNPTIPKEPKFHNPQHKKIKCMSWNDINLAINADEMRNGKER
ncbi:microtubule-destabilizing protein 60-like [Magnolia sinica]|uniref:microtubule-destabilizing protein 60-like n=1 Tax=Magnolia sinica TaxID=86752 RepID=UPI0026590C1E|nr:microtubule-destabilizing protein 60-like [Magnolia sinica]